MRVETLTVHCDTYGCTRSTTGSARMVLRAEGWLLTATQDLCPMHAPSEYGCSRCGGEFTTLAEFDAHLTACRKKAR